jgi:CMP-N,N'-diacetyllegionaminic acid synthase
MINNKEILCLIIARGGSKSVPRKNLMLLNNKPLIYYSIKQGLESKYIDRVIVSTDDLEIMEVSKECGAETPFLRPAEIAEDLTPDIDVFLHAVTWLKENENYNPDYIVDLRAPDAGGRKLNNINKAIEIITSNPNADSLRSMRPAECDPRTMWIEKNGIIKPLLRDTYDKTTSFIEFDHKDYFWQNGYVDIIKTNTITDKKKMAGDNIISYILNEKSYSLDYQEDIEKVESLLREQ